MDGEITKDNQNNPESADFSETEKDSISDKEDFGTENETPSPDINIKEKKKDKMKEKRTAKKGTPITAYLPVKILSAFILTISTAVTVICSVLVFQIEADGYYSPNGFDYILDAEQQYIAMRNSIQVMAYASGNLKNEALSFLNDRNVAYLKIKDGETNKIIYEYYRNEEIKKNLPTKAYKGYQDGFYWEVRLLPTLPIHTDAYYANYRKVSFLYNIRLYVIYGIIAGVFFFILSLFFFVGGIGRSPYEEGITENYLTKIPFDVFTLLAGIPAAICVFFCGVTGDEFEITILLTIAGFFFGLWLINLIHRIKLGVVFENTITLKFLKFIWKLFLGFPLIWKTVLTIVIYLFVELFVLIFVGGITNDSTVILIFFLLCLRNIFLFPFILYRTYMARTVQKGVQKLAKGDNDTKIDTSFLIGDYRKEAESVNNISDSISIAVEERLKSERMKTELITNVSHDIKTPLTSVINYSDLINTEANNIIEEKTSDQNGSMQNIVSYSEVLNRQSNKLKRLLEDLLDISKASSGTMEINLEKIEIGTLLSQASAEYEERFEKQNLETIINIAEDGLYVKADSRKIWRVFDNLLQNICKYSIPNGRVYLSAERNKDKVDVIFRNISREQITVSAEELTERFTRNDESRHQEGNGLGLAIAKTITELQGGKFKVDIDGDLFKVTVTLDSYME
ncbi:MAG: HAMP domain-containing histidine kinase [Lachnospiraceae bacterium]|nr:HAMP domain-containing histidine kinase [Lachnospiraceae bacterium]